MARTKQTVRKSTDGKQPRKTVSNDGGTATAFATTMATDEETATALENLKEEMPEEYRNMVGNKRKLPESADGGSKKLSKKGPEEGKSTNGKQRANAVVRVQCSIRCWLARREFRVTCAEMLNTMTASEAATVLTALPEEHAAAILWCIDQGEHEPGGKDLAWEFGAEILAHMTYPQDSDGMESASEDGSESDSGGYENPWDATRNKAAIESSDSE